MCVTILSDLFLYAVGYVVCINVVAFAVYAYDKYCARKSRRRISEATLLLLAAVGGAAGAWLSMLLFRHKTRHLKFTVLVPLLLLLQVLLAWSVL